MNKAELRRHLRRLRGTIEDGEIARAGRAVSERVLALPEVASARAVMCYLSVRRELPTRALADALRARTTVAVPRVIDAERMEARAWAEPLVPGVLGIPTSDGPIVHGIEVALCPGLAFDRSGARLGYGAGYYDRWLSAHPDVVAIGLAFDEALLDAVPVAPHDRRMDLVVTPGEVVRCADYRLPPTR